MRWFHNMKIAQKLILSFGFVAMIAGAIGYVGISQLNKLRASGTAMYEYELVPTSLISSISTYFQRVRVNSRDIILRNAPEDIELHTRRMAEYRQKIDGLVPEFEKRIQREEMRRLFAEFSAAAAEYSRHLDHLVSLAQANRDDEAFAYLKDKEFENTMRKEMNLIASIDSAEVAYAAARSEENAALAQSAARMMLIILCLGVVVALGLGYYISRVVGEPVRTLVGAADKLALGNVDVHIDSDSRDEIGDLSRAFDRMVENIRENAAAAKEIARGNLDVAIEAKSSDDVLAKSMQQVIEALHSLTSEAGMLTRAAVEGRLETRGNADKFTGGYREIVKGVNDTLDAVIGPLKIAANYVDRISRGDIPPRITDAYSGDFNEIKNNLNQCIDAVNLLVADAGMLSKAAVDGKLDTRADAAKHAGDFRKIVEGVNATLDAVIEPVKEAVTVIESMAEGNLSLRVNGSYRGDHAQMKDALNRTGESLNDILTQVNVAADQVVSGSRQVSDASQSLSQGATEQASSLEEITASMTEMTGQTRQNADNAQQANKLASAARDTALRGNDQMQQMLGAMKEINESSGQISKIIKVIDEIAFQTNLLALNAAVEAARAGVHGKGFAVVADEVRNLAQRSAKAAKETTELIETSIKKVDNGQGIANETARALGEIVSGVTKVTDLVGEIASASNEQAQGISQVNQGLNQIDQVTQANTASAEESASAAEELTGQATTLKSMLTRFVLEGNRAQYTPRRPEPPVYAGNDGAHSGNGKGRGKAAVSGSGRNGSSGRMAAAGVSPAEVIALDDDEFGRY